jgi:hypothetical protein
MLKTIACITLAATALMAWETLTSVPESVAVQEGACITYGADSIWGVFPDADEDITYAGRYQYDANGGVWSIFDDEMAGYAMTNTACTFQWLEDGVFFVIGSEGEDPMLYFYNLHDGEWDYDDLDFNLNDGACIAYQPNVNYNSQLYPVPGWLYCLPGNGTDFWRYSIPTSLPDQALDGIFPGNLAVIADKTPNFEWPGFTGNYQLQVSTLQSFATTVINVYVSPSDYQATSTLANNTYFWRTRDLNGSGAWSTVHSFQLSAGWSQLVDDIPEAVYDGAAMAYDNYDHEAVIAFTFAGTSLVTSRAAGGASPTPWASFGGLGTSDYLYYYRYDIVAWYRWTAGPTFPTTLRTGSSMAYGPDDYVYLTVGEDGSGNPRSDFYRQQLPWGDDGPQAAAMRSARGATRVITRSDGISVEYQLRAPCHVRATLRDVSGRLVSSIDAGEQTTGSHRLDLASTNDEQRLASGAYFVLIDMGTEQAKLKAVIQ